MASILLLLGCLLAGAVLKRIPGFPAQAHQGLNAFIIYLSLPSLTLLYIPKLSLEVALLYPVGMAWLVFLLGMFLFRLLGEAFNWDPKTQACLMLCAGLGNTSFIGFPLITQFYGEDGLVYAILCDQPGSFLALSTLGMGILAFYSGGKPSLPQILKQVIRFPPFTAFLISICLVPFGGLPKVFHPMLEALGGCLTPLALVSIGLQLTLPRQRFPWQSLGVGLGYKLLLAPALIYGLYAGILNQQGLMIDVSVLEAAMGPMITPTILVMEKDLNRPLAGLLIAVGIPLSLITVYAWHAFLAA